MAKKFEYRLEKILKIRQQIRDQKLSDLVQVRNYIGKIESNQQIVSDEKQKEKDLRGALNDQGYLNVQSTIDSLAYEGKLTSAMFDLNRQMAQAKHWENVKIEELKLATVQCKTLEKHKEKLNRQSISDENKRELSELDELAIQRQSKDF